MKKVRYEVEYKVSTVWIYATQTNRKPSKKWYLNLCRAMREMNNNIKSFRLIKIEEKTNVVYGKP